MGWPVLVPSLGPPAARGCAQLAPLRGPGARLRGAGRRGGSQAAAAQDAGGRFRDLMGFLDGKSIGSIRGYTILDGIFVDFWWEKKTNLFFYILELELYGKDRGNDIPFGNDWGLRVIWHSHGKSSCWRGKPSFQVCCVFNGKSSVNSIGTLNCQRVME